MARIGITLNEVLRDFLGQLTYTYEKYIDETDIEEDTITEFDLMKYFDFASKDEMNAFLYDEAALEIFGHADQVENNLMNKFNMFHMDIKDDEEHEIEIVSREVNKSIPSTLFFLSKLSCRVEKIRFVMDYEDYWDGVDVLITANPRALETKPEGKISIKINSSYNKDSKSDFELDSILEFMTDETLREKILNTKITTYEEIDD
jgi:hypothetical protein